MPLASDQIADEIVDALALATGDQGVSMDTVLEDVLPDEGDLEVWLQEQEQRFNVKLTDPELMGCFTSWTAKQLAAAVTKHAMARVKTAAANEQQARQKAHQRYVANRGMHVQRARAYRMLHMHAIRRKSKAYRRKVKRKMHRPQKRVGTAAGGYSFIPR